MKKNTSKIPMPVRRTYPPEVKPAPIGELPFVYIPGYTPKISSNWHRRRCRTRNASHWRLPNASVYRVACQIGYECGAHFAQYLKDQPDWSCYGVLRRILADIDFKDSSPNKGYTVGFIYYMERLVRFAAMDIDVFADVDQTNAYYDDMEARTALEEAAEIDSK